MEGPSLLLRPDKAGDALKTLPALRALQNARPDLSLHILVSSHNASLFEFEPGVRAYRLPDHWRELKPEVLRSELSHQGLPSAFSKIVSLPCDPFEESDRLLKTFRGTERYATRTLDPKLATEVTLVPLPGNTPAGRDETRNIALLLSQVFSCDLDPLLTQVERAPLLVPSDHEEARILMGPKEGLWVGFCPFAGLAHRTHPLRKWEAFLPFATRMPFVGKLFLFGSPSDCHRLERLRDRCYRPERVQLCYPSSFRTLGAYLLRLDGMVGVDSGPLHLARALGVRSLGFLSGGDVLRWFALSEPGDRLLRRGLFGRFPSAWEMSRAFQQWILPLSAQRR